MDIFENTILCKKCNRAMKPSLISKNGFNLRIIKCEKCGEAIVHPADKNEYEDFMRLKQKEFNVKMRMIGNSYAVSIPRQIVDFMRDQESLMDNMVKMCFEEAGTISMRFNTPEGEKDESKPRIVKSKEIRVVRNGKPVLHARKFFDSAHPERNKDQVYKNQESEEELEDGR